MPTTNQMLDDYPDILLQVLAELRGAFLDAADNRQQAITLLAAQITDPTSVQFAYQEVMDMSEQARAAVDGLLAENGEMIEAQFSRQFGGIRQMGPAKLNREAPWLYPENVSELLYYYGLLGRGFKGTGQNAHTIVYLPSDIIPWLPRPQQSDDDGALPVQSVPPPPVSRTLPSDEAFLSDTGTLLGFLYTDGLRLTPEGPHPEDVDRLVQRFQIPFGVEDELLNSRLALLLHLAKRLGWLRRDEQGMVRITNNRVRLFMERTRAEQRADLWSAWRESPEWNDLCRTPCLECAETGTWHNDPLQTRHSILALLGRLQPGGWYSQADVIEAIKEAEPDFQRPTGNYDTWYVRNTTTQEFLKGFEQWDAVEGALLRFLFQGPLWWLGALDLAEPSAGDDMQISLSQWGARWLDHEVPEPHDSPRRPVVIGEDFSLTLALDTPLADRFRVERFAQWESSYPQYVYKISRRSLQRAAQDGVSSDRILAFLRQRSQEIPNNVVAALERRD